LTRDLEVAPQGPYSLALSARIASGATRRFQDGRLTAAVRVAGEVELASARQRPDGVVVLQGSSDEGLARLRFQLGLDDDHTPFLEAFAEDPLLGETVRRLRGFRPLRLGSVAQALLKAVAGQLIDSRRARATEQRVIRAATPAHEGGLHAPPECAELARFAPAELRALGLGARRGAALVRICRSLELERLHDLPTAAAAARLGREPGLGPWSVGVICLEGLGRPERGLVGDLGLVKLLARLRGGRHVEPEETVELLAPYGDWAGLASVYLLKGMALGLVPARAAA